MRFMYAAVLITAVFAISGCWSKKEKANEVPVAASRPTIRHRALNLLALEPPRDMPLPQGTSKVPQGRISTAYLGTDGGGLIRLQDGIMTRILEEPGHISHIEPADEISFWVVANYKVHRLTGDEFVELKQPTNLPVERIASGNNEILWMEDMDSLHRFDGTTWTSLPIRDIDPRTDHLLVKDIDVDSNGDLWVFSADHIYYRTQNEWHRCPLPVTDSKKEPRLGRGRLGNPGGLWVTTNQGLLRWAEDGLFLARSRLGDWDMGLIAVDFDGFFLGQVEDRLIRISDDLETVMEFAIPALPDAPDNVEVSAQVVDADGRLWLATEKGVYVWPRSADPIRLPLTSAAELGAPVVSLWVDGTPELPPPGSHKTGTIKGILVAEGRPIPNATVQLCPRPDRTWGRTPCSNSPFRRTATSANNGVIKLDQVPIGEYRFAVKQGDTWLLSGESVGSEMKPGQILDIGTLEVLRTQVRVVPKLEKRRRGQTTP